MSVRSYCEVRPRRKDLNTGLNRIQLEQVKVRGRISGFTVMDEKWTKFTNQALNELV